MQYSWPDITLTCSKIGMEKRIEKDQIDLKYMLEAEPVLLNNGFDGG